MTGPSFLWPRPNWQSKSLSLNANLKKDEIQAREDIIIAFYEEAIKLGQRRPGCCQ